MDRWVLSKLNSLVKTVDEGLDQYRITESARAIQAFVDELSNWYVRLSKSRFWGKDWTGDKKAAYETLYTVLTTLCKLAAPFIPFMTESMYRNLASVQEGAPESVHLCDYPVCDESKIDQKLEAEMEEVAQAVTLGRACRNTANIKVRQALSTLYVKGSKLSDACAALIRDELNVEKVEFIDDARAFTSYQIKPQMKTVGPKYGKLLNAIKAHLAEVDGNAFVDALERDGAVKFDIDGNEVALTAEDCLISPAQKPGFVAETERDMTVVIDTNLTPELIEKGFVREVISKLQTMRKEAGGGLRRGGPHHRDLYGLRGPGPGDRQKRRRHRRRRAGHGHLRGRRPRGRLRQGMEHQRRKGRAGRSEEGIATAKRLFQNERQIPARRRGSVVFGRSVIVAGKRGPPVPSA